MPDYDFNECDDWCQKQAMNLASLFVANLEQFIRYKDEKPVNVLINKFLSFFDSAVQKKIFPKISSCSQQKHKKNSNAQRLSDNERSDKTFVPIKNMTENASIPVESLPITFNGDFSNHLIMKSLIKMRVESKRGDGFFDAVVSMQEHSSSYFLEFSFGHKDTKGLDCVVQFFSKEEKQQWLVAFHNFFGDRFASYLSSNSFHFDMPTEKSESIALEDNRLRLLPWYHGHLSRSDAARIVIRGHHGSYLLRNSETRKDELVLTFNVVGRAKHLRLSILKDGRCVVQNMQFESVRHMIEHFKMTPSVFLKNGSDPQRFELINWIPRLIPRNGISVKDQSIDNSYGIC